jgi:hypothetical protein
MAETGSKSSTSIGFLTVCEHEGQGLFGGYLLLNLAGRPLEFYCTAPVRPNRAQEILYGPTLKPYLYGEQIGQTLLEKAKTKPVLVFTDVEPALAVRQHVATPVVLVLSSEQAAQVARAGRLDGLQGGGDAAPLAFAHRLQLFTVGEQSLAVPQAYARDADQVVTQWQSHAAEFDVREPFQRIRDAIDEARRSAKQAA